MNQQSWLKNSQLNSLAPENAASQQSKSNAKWKNTVMWQNGRNETAI